MAEAPDVTGGPEVIRATTLDGVPHGFLGRRGGVSTGLVAGLNAGPGSGDDEAAIAENRLRAARAVLPGAALVGVYQVHSPHCVTVVDPWPDSARPEADALVTDRSGILLAILTADCAPVLLADREAGVVGAAHAGWKGALGGVTDRTIAAMEALGAKRARIAAAIGPCIAQPSYEVDAAFAARFAGADPGNVRFFAPGRPGHAHFDLEDYVAHRLEISGSWPGSAARPRHARRARALLFLPPRHARRRAGLRSPDFADCSGLSALCAISLGAIEKGQKHGWQRGFSRLSARQAGPRVSFGWRMWGGHRGAPRTREKQGFGLLRQPGAGH